jgi:hypothetical protein
MNRDTQHYGRVLLCCVINADYKKRAVVLKNKWNLLLKIILWNTSTLERFTVKTNKMINSN